MLTIVGAITAFFAATVGLVQNDIKKIIAYSTCSQLGYMFFVCGTSNYSTGLFHLANHAFFKALLFLSAGSIIHALSNEQDIRKMGGLVNLMPFTYAMFLIGSLALAGFPFLSGFYSKDVILELAYTKYSISGTFAYWLGTLTAFFTAFYSFRLIYYVFYSPINAYKNIVRSVHESPFVMTLPLFLLSICSIFSGYLLRDIFIGLGSNFFTDSIYILPQNVIIIDSEFIPYYIKLLPTVMSLLGMFLSVLSLKSFEVIYVKLGLIKPFNTVYNFLIHK
jgi:NADH-ubiquinone oxidoreductase chain 5